MLHAAAPPAIDSDPPRYTRGFSGWRDDGDDDNDDKDLTWMGGDCAHSAVDSLRPRMGGRGRSECGISRCSSGESRGRSSSFPLPHVACVRRGSGGRNLKADVRAHSVQCEEMTRTMGGEVRCGEAMEWKKNVSTNEWGGAAAAAVYTTTFGNSERRERKYEESIIIISYVLQLLVVVVSSQRGTAYYAISRPEPARDPRPLTIYRTTRRSHVYAYAYAMLRCYVPNCDARARRSSDGRKDRGWRGGYIKKRWVKEGGGEEDGGGGVVSKHHATPRPPRRLNLPKPAGA
ncbi:hypothetical protein DFH94DRAFT_683746 [Russula ochroleuca]|uniref:Uncharacterized protein n=1 Tax=Russula ochroleuca TaxID=152965 RepID=A0A9P5T5K2_9AGAM|nr:hypothetical protein DFH94DRAFT_683746 [Russula ochroleuca]